MVQKPSTDLFTICVGLRIAIPEATPVPSASLRELVLFSPAAFYLFGQIHTGVVVSIAARKFSHGVGVKIWLGLGFGH